MNQKPKLPPTFDPAKLVKAIGGLEQWRNRCHEASLAIVRTGMLGKNARVARGTHARVPGQHSWVCRGNPYWQVTTIIDPTLWSHTGYHPYLNIAFGGMDYQPKGAGNIDWRIRISRIEDRIDLDVDWSLDAWNFLKTIAPDGLDRYGWNLLANQPVMGWASKEIIGAMYRDDRTRALIPIDVVGMLLDENPGNLYW